MENQKTTIEEIEDEELAALNCRSASAGSARALPQFDITGNVLGGMVSTGALIGLLLQTEGDMATEVLVDVAKEYGMDFEEIKKFWIAEECDECGMRKDLCECAVEA